MRRLHFTNTVKILGLVATVFVVYGLVWLDNSVNITNPKAEGPKSSLAGLPCAHTTDRPIAIMLASDPEARPLAGISQADLVIEMPVTPNGITRMMAVFQCQRPVEIGSVRSAREDFLPLVAGLDAIYAHWGGEQNALKQLEAGVLDNINGLVYDGTIFHRKKEIRPPHNGFITFANLQKVIKQLHYETKDQFVGYPHKNKPTSRSLANVADTIAIPYPGDFAVVWNYDKATNSYLRVRANRPELDRNTNTQVRASVVIVMETTFQPIDYQYINVRTKGTGHARIFQDGVVIEGTWRKDIATLDSKLTFLDAKGVEILLTPGPLWVEIVTGSTQ